MNFSYLVTNGQLTTKHSLTIVYYFYIRCVHREVKRLQYPFV